MSEFASAPRLGVGDPAAGVSDLARQARVMTSGREALAGLTGSAESEDRTIRAVVGPEGLRELVIEPRAMRLPSADLATTIVGLVRDASADLTRVRREKLDELGVAAPRIDLEESRAKLAELEALTRAGDGDMVAVYERFRRQLGL